MAVPVSRAERPPETRRRTERAQGVIVWNTASLPRGVGNTASGCSPPRRALIHPLMTVKMQSSREG